MPNLSAVFLAFAGIVLAYIGGSFFRFARFSRDGSEVVVRSRTRALGFCFCLISLLMCASSATVPVSISPESDGSRANIGPVIAAILGWLIGVFLGTRRQFTQFSAKWFSLLVTLLLTLWWVTREPGMSMEDLMLLLGVTVLATVTFVTGQKARKQSETAADESR